MNNDLFPKAHPLGHFRLRRWLVPLSLAALCLAFALGGEAARDWARYDRAGLEAGEIWRLATGHLVHLGWGHLWPNVLALLLIGGLVEEFLAPLEWIGVTIAAALAIDLGLYAFEPDLPWYVGLSGVLHGVVACGALLMLDRGHFRIGAPLAIGLAAKLVFEQIQGPVPLTQASVGGNVIVAAHLYGAVGGTLSGAAFRFSRRREPRL